MSTNIHLAKPYFRNQSSFPGSFLQKNGSLPIYHFSLTGVPDANTNPQGSGKIIMNYFENVSNLDELRKTYHRLAFENHPDRGGQTVVMQEINNQYEKLSFSLISSNTDFSEGRKEWEAQVSEELREKLQSIINLPNITLEIIGSWIWVTGNTFSVRDILRSHDFIFSHSKTAWYWHKGEYFKKTGVLLSLEKIRELYGNEKVESELQEQLN